MGEIIARNMLSWLKLLIKLLLLYLVGYLYCCINDARSHKHQIRHHVRHTLKTKEKCVALNNTVQLDLDKIHLRTTVSRVMYSSWNFSYAKCGSNAASVIWEISIGSGFPQYPIHVSTSDAHMLTYTHTHTHQVSLVTKYPSHCIKTTWNLYTEIHRFPNSVGKIKESTVRAPLFRSVLVVECIRCTNTTFMICVLSRFCSLIHSVGSHYVV